MIAVQVAEHHRIDLTRFEVMAFHGGQTGGTTVDQRGVTVLLQADARLEPAAAAEGVPAADEPDLHLTTLAPVGDGNQLIEPDGVVVCLRHHVCPEPSPRPSP